VPPNHTLAWHARANRHYLLAYVWCDAMIAGALAQRCNHGPPPHRIKAWQKLTTFWQAGTRFKGVSAT
jgi:hypothetical protein